MLSGFLFSVKSVKYEAKTKHLFLLKMAFFQGTEQLEYRNNTDLKLKNPNHL